MYASSKTATNASTLQFDSHPFKEKFYCFNENEKILQYPISMFVRRNFKLKSILNLSIRRIFESGIIELWKKKLMREKLFKQQGVGLLQFRIDQQESVIFLWFAGIMMASFVFCIEWITFRLIQCG